MDAITKEFIGKSQRGAERIEFCRTGCETLPGDSDPPSKICRTQWTVGSCEPGKDKRPEMRALIVDDSRFIRRYLRRLLEQIGLRCEEASDGCEALQLLRGSTSFDFMLLDVNMPHMSGLECVKTIREAGLHPPMKVMMVTTEADHSFIRRALEYGADEFLMKPFSLESLREKLLMLGLAA